MASSASRAFAKASSAARRSASAEAFTPGTSSLRKPSSAACVSLRTRIALRDPRDVAGPEDRDARAGDEELAGRRPAGGGSGRRQIGQFSTKRL